VPPIGPLGYDPQLIRPGYDTKMQNHLTSSVLVTLLALGGCSATPTEDAYRTSSLERLPFVYKMPVQQGNLVTEEMIDALQPGMNKRQVRYLLGTALLMDMFHEDRWDYSYTIRRGHDPMQVKRVTIWFKDDALVRIDGDMKPDPQRAAGRTEEEIVVTVPDWKDNRGFLTRAMTKIGLEESR
jgi:outer membrane protein assembly factor BamE